MQTRKHVPIIAVLLGLLASLVAVLPSASADESPWPKLVSMNYRQLQSTPDGGIVAACGDVSSYDDPVTASFSPTGDKRTEVYTAAGSWYSHLSCGSSVVTKAGLIVSQGEDEL